MPDDKKIYTPKEVAAAALKKFLELSIKATEEGKGELLEKSVKSLKKEDAAGMMEASEKSKKSKKELKKEDPSPAGSLNAQIGFPFGKAEDKSNPDEKEDAELGEKVEQDVEDHIKQNPEAHQDYVKGHIKLAKFMGHIEGKRSAKVMPDSGNDELTKPIDHVAGEMDKAETGHEKGVHTGGYGHHEGGEDDMENFVESPGTSGPGALVTHAKNLKNTAKKIGVKNTKHWGEEQIKEAKRLHEDKIAEQKAMPKPKLPK